jgi:hypothetical protein
VLGQALGPRVEKPERQHQLAGVGGVAGPSANGSTGSLPLLFARGFAEEFRVICAHGMDISTMGVGKPAGRSD